MLYGFLHKLPIWESKAGLEELTPHDRKSIGGTIQNTLKNSKALWHTDNQITGYRIQVLLLIGSLCDLQSSIDEVP